MTQISCPSTKCQQGEQHSILCMLLNGTKWAYNRISNFHVFCSLLFDPSCALPDMELTKRAFVVVHGQLLSMEYEQKCCYSKLTDRLDSCLHIDHHSNNASLLQCLKNPKSFLRAPDHASGVSENLLLLSLYCKHGALDDARALFDSILRDIYAWNFMISAYSRLEKGTEAWQIFSQMQMEGIMPNKFIFVSILSAFATQTALSQGKQIHSILNGCECSTDRVVRTALLNMYGKCGSLENARIIFDLDPKLDVVLWNAMMASYVKHGKAKDALILFNQMQQLGVLPNKLTCISVLSASASEANPVEGKRCHACIVGIHIESDIVVGTALVNMYSKCRMLQNAVDMFHRMPKRDLVLWNAIISGFAQNGQYEGSLQLYDQMQHEGVMPNKVTCTIIFDACASHSSLAKCRLIHVRMVGNRYESDVAVGNALVTMYAKCGSLGDAVRCFEKMPARDVTLWNSMIAAFVKQGQCQKALQFYDQMEGQGILPNKITFVTALSACARKAELLTGKKMHDHITCGGFESDVALENALINMYGKCGSLQDALAIFETMPLWDDTTLVNILSASTSQVALAEGKKIHAFIEDNGIKPNIVVSNALVNMYSKCGSLEDAQWIFDKMPKQNTISWAAIIAAYAQHGKGKESVLLFDQMHQRRIMPDEITFVSILSACSHAGLLDEAHNCFLFIKNNGCKPTLDHYNCLLDLLGRLGRLDDAENLVNHMPFQPTSLSWTTFLGACQNLVDMERVECAAKHVSEVDPDNAVPFVRLLKLHAALGGEEDMAIAMQKAT